MQSDFAKYLTISNEEIKKELWAIQLSAFYQLAPGAFSDSLITQFESIFPNSGYQNILRKQYAAYQEPATSEISLPYLDSDYVSQVPIIYIDSIGKETSLLQTVKRNFPNQIVYIDIWASWCTPCIGEFRFNSVIDPLLSRKDIKRLYISIDGMGSKTAWENVINKYKLGGGHLIAGTLMIQDIKRNLLLNQAEGIRIPRYLIVKNGKITSNDAPRPSDPKLIDLIDKK